MSFARAAPSWAESVCAQARSGADKACASGAHQAGHGFIFQWRQQRLAPDSPRQKSQRCSAKFPALPGHSSQSRAALFQPLLSLVTLSQGSVSELHRIRPTQSRPRGSSAGSAGAAACSVGAVGSARLTATAATALEQTQLTHPLESLTLAARQHPVRDASIQRLSVILAARCSLDNALLRGSSPDPHPRLAAASVSDPILSLSSPSLTLAPPSTRPSASRYGARRLRSAVQLRRISSTFYRLGLETLIAIPRSVPRPLHPPPHPLSRPYPISTSSISIQPTMFDHPALRIASCVQKLWRTPASSFGPFHFEPFDPPRADRPAPSTLFPPAHRTNLTAKPPRHHAGVAHLILFVLIRSISNRYPHGALRYSHYQPFRSSAAFQRASGTMVAATLLAANELRIDTSSVNLEQLDTGAELPTVEAAQLSPKVDRVRHHLIPARTTTCVRAPCLKRQASVPISAISSTTAASRIDAAPIQDRVASNPLPTSFAAPRNLSLSAAVRHVHFDESPPEEFYVLSGASYDRRPIKCTQGGSEFDMSLPPRATSYNGDESGEDEASSLDEPIAAMESADAPAPDVGFFHDPTLENWACIKNGTVIASVGYQPRQQQSGLMASGKSLHFSALSPSQHASAMANVDCKPDTSSLYQPQRESSSQKVSLPVHGFRSFGGLQNSLAPELTSPFAHTEPSPPPKQAPLSPETTPPAPRHFSPDATPMPSPSLHKSIGAYASVSYFGVGSDPTQPSSLPASTTEDKAHTQESVQGAMEVLRDVPSPTTSVMPDEARTAAPARLHTGPSSPLATVMPEPVVQQTVQPSVPRRVAMERRGADKEAVRLSSLQPPAAAHGSAPAASPGWSSLLGATSSPLSSRCSSVDPWSSLSSDGDGDGTESPGNENSWISSNCTSPDLSPFEQMVEGLNCKPSGTAPRSVYAGRGAEAVSAPSNGSSHLARGSHDDQGDWDYENTPKGFEFGEEAKFSSSVETVHTTSWEQRHVQAVASAAMLAGLSSGDVSTSEATTPDSSRRPSFHHAEMSLARGSPRLRTSFGDLDGGGVDQLDDDDSHVMRVRSVSREGHAKKKTTKCRFCRSLRQRLKVADAESSAPTSSGGSAQMTDAESEAASTPETGGATSLHRRDLTSSTEVSEMEEDEARSRSPIAHLRASVRSLSIESCGTSRSRSREGSALSQLAIARESSQHDRESSNSPADSACESAYLSASNVASVCTCDKKREKERLKKKLRKERELERERDREWERDQAKGRQKKLFGESFGDADNSCLSALDGF